MWHNGPAAAKKRKRRLVTLNKHSTNRVKAAQKLKVDDKKEETM